MYWLRKLLGDTPGQEEDPNHSASIIRIRAALDHLPESQARFLSSFALLLARVAHCDQEISAGERQRIGEMLGRFGGLNEEQADLVVSIAVETTLAHAVEHHIVLREMNEVSTREQKIAVIRALLHLAAEEDISEEESGEIGSVASALLLSRGEFLALRSEFREHLRILKNLPR